jgi:3-phosphoshikimate 1-carboxyvinyltransferase
MSTLIDGLRQAGTAIDDFGNARLPFVIHGSGAVAGGAVHIDASGSSQFVSGLLLAGARYDKGIEIVHTGSSAGPSQPHLDMTVSMVRAAGVAATTPAPGCWLVEPGAISGRTWVVEPDLSNAAPFLAAALLAGGTVRIPRWPEATTQPGDALRQLLARMGADVRVGDGQLIVRGTGTITAIDVDLRNLAELATVVAALAAFADGPSHLTGLAHMRGHETDRLAALATELTRLGGDVLEDAGSLTIYPRPLHAGVWHSYADHRMATAGAVLGLRVDGVAVEDIACTTKTLPDFPGMWARLVGA